MIKLLVSSPRAQLRVGGFFFGGALLGVLWVEAGG